MDILSCLVTMPRPLQFLQGLSMVWPFPPHMGHWPMVMNWLYPWVLTLRSWPDPPHLGQVLGEDPFSAPVPPHSWQVAVCGTSISLSTPRAASSRVIHVVAEVVALLGTVGVAPPAAEQVERPAEEAEVVEHVLQVGEVRELVPCEALVAERLLDALVAVLVVELSLAVVSQHLVGLGDLLELLLGLLVARILVRVEAQRLLAVGLLNLVG